MQKSRLLCLLIQTEAHEFLSIMKVILDELRKNNVDIDMTTVSYHMHQCLEQYKIMYEEMATRVEAVDLPDIFNDMNVNNFGRAMAYLTLVYVLKGSENVTREAVRLVATVLKDMDFAAFNVEQSFFPKNTFGDQTYVYILKYTNI